MKLLIIVLVVTFAFVAPLTAQYSSSPVEELERRITSLEHKMTNLPDEGLVVFLFAAFCALWAMNTGRNSWLWFFLGLFFSVITVLVLLYKNSKDRQQTGRRPFNLQDFRKQ